MSMKLSIIIPVYNEANQIKPCLSNLEYLKQEGHEIIVVDGGSDDATIELAKPICDTVIQSPKSRSVQMNTGAYHASGDYLLFLHVDTVLPDNVTELFQKIDKSHWGRFDITLSGKHFMFRVIEFCMNLRSRLTGIATGDQVMFIDKKLFMQLNGYPEIALMEDIALSKLLLACSQPICFKEKVVSSSRRWEKHGIVNTILKMWTLRILYFFNVDTNKLAKMYS